MSVERIYFEQIKSFEETLDLIQKQLDSSYQPLTRLNNIRQILGQHNFIFNELYRKTSLTDSEQK